MLSSQKDLMVVWRIWSHLGFQPVRCRAFAAWARLAHVGTQGVSELILFAEQTNWRWLSGFSVAFASLTEQKQMQQGIELLLVPCFSKSSLSERWNTHSWCKDKHKSVARPNGSLGMWSRTGAHQSQPVFWHRIIFPALGSILCLELTGYLSSTCLSCNCVRLRVSSQLPIFLLMQRVSQRSRKLTVSVLGIKDSWETWLRKSKQSLNGRPTLGFLPGLGELESLLLPDTVLCSELPLDALPAPVDSAPGVIWVPGGPACFRSRNASEVDGEVEFLPQL